MPTENTPANTPLPGGGSWHWDDALGAWAENPPYGAVPDAIVATASADPQSLPSSTPTTSE